MHQVTATISLCQTSIVWDADVCETTCALEYTRRHSGVKLTSMNGFKKQARPPLEAGPSLHGSHLGILRMNE